MERSSIEPVFVGIDVAKGRLDVHLHPVGKAFAVGRDVTGLRALTEHLVAAAPSLIVLEATGGFEVAVAAALAAGGLPLAVVNPRQVRDFARATGRLAKHVLGRPSGPTRGTDRLDAEASLGSPRPSDRSHARSRTKPPGPSASWSPAAGRSSR